MGNVARFLEERREQERRSGLRELEEGLRGIAGDPAGVRSIALSLAEHPDWHPGELTLLAAWRRAHGFDREDVLDSNGRPCPGCLELIDQSEIGAEWSRVVTDPETGERTSVLERSSVSGTAAAHGLARVARARIGAGITSRVLYHPSQVSCLNPTRTVRSLPVAEASDPLVASRLARACAGVEVGKFDELTDWCFSRRYGMGATLSELDELELHRLSVEALAERVDRAQRILATACERVDAALGVGPGRAPLPGARPARSLSGGRPGRRELEREKALAEQHK